MTVSPSESVMIMTLMSDDDDDNNDDAECFPMAATGALLW